MSYIKQKLRKMADAFMLPYIDPILRACRNDAATQITLALRYKELAERGGPLPSFSEVGFRAYSQTDEDGILLYLFSILGTTNKTSVEIGVENGLECNTANLALNHGWNCVMFDGSARDVRAGQAFYAQSRDTWIWPPRLVQAWVETDNINSLIQAQNVEGEIDLLSIDVDGIDYWLWQAVTVVHPRVVVIEYNSCFPAPLSVTIPNRRGFSRSLEEPDYYGASLSAFVALAHEKGYRLAGCNRLGFNAFFVRNDLAIDVLLEVAAHDCLCQPRSLQLQATNGRLWEHEWIRLSAE